MRYIVKVEELSTEVLEKLKKNSRIIHIFSLIDNTIALETEDVERIKELRGVKRVYESGKAKLMLHDALNIIGILDVHNRGFYGDGVWIGVIDSGIDISDPLVSGSIVLERDFTSASAALLLSVDDADKRRIIDAILGTAEDKGFPKWVQGQGLIRPDKALEVIVCD